MTVLGTGRAAGGAVRYPFSAIVGLPDLKLALLLNAVDPAIGGVLVRGEKGTAKSTVVRALAALLPSVRVVDGCRFSCDPDAPDPSCPDGPHADSRGSTRDARMVELPVGASEDRLTGSLDLRRALSEGVATFEPGLLAAAHRGLLYVDEVNLLHDHLVDLLLDAAALGTSYVEREGVSVRHAARFLLVGTMNPEEGELRPQLLDRFGLTVEVAATRDATERAEVVRRRLAYDADPAGFAEAWAEADAELAARIADARTRLASVELSDAALRQVTAVCAAFDVDGLRADLVTARTAVALAAWSGRTSVTADDVRQAALLALPHRRRRDPFDAPGLDEDQLDQAIQNATGPDDPDDDPGGGSRPGTDGSGAADGTGDADDEAPGHDGAAADGRRPGRDTSPGTGPGGADDPASAGSGPADPTPEHTGAQAEDEARGPGDQTGKRGHAGDRPTADGDDRTADSAAKPYKPRLFRVPGIGSGTPGRRSRTRDVIGRTVGSRPAEGRVTALHLPATLRAAAPHQLARRTGGGAGTEGGFNGRSRTEEPTADRTARYAAGPDRNVSQADHGRDATGTRHGTASAGRASADARNDAAGSERATAVRREVAPPGACRPLIEPGDLRTAVREGREGNLVVFCVDASGSMAARRRVRAVTGAALSLLLDAYQRRDKVALITFRGTRAEVALPPTSSVDVGAARLRGLRVGGRTPLAEGLLRAYRLLAAERLRDPRRRPLLVLITDGRATYGDRPREDAERAAALLAGTGVSSVVVDCESGPVRLGLAARLAGVLGGERIELDELAADRISGVVHAARAAA